MANLVLTQKAGSGYDDVRGDRYHFPKTYLKQAQQGVGDFFVYYEPRRPDGREAYVGWGQAGQITADPLNPDHYYLQIIEQSYQDFPRPVPFREGLESGVFKHDGTANKGAFGRSVRVLPTDEFVRIVRSGFREELLAELEPRLPGLILGQPEPELGSREIVRVLTTRALRDRAFARQVQDAYEGTCALTGVRVENGGGWLEMEAAHIQPVKSRGPDSIQNGLALSRTVHALFDRGFISLGDDFEILVSQTHPVHPKIMGLLGDKARVPRSRALRPHPAFLRFHRENVFKHRAA